MESVLSLVFAVSALCAASMGFAIQRGATCAVAAVDEWVSTRRATRLASMLEASLWVVAGLLLARVAGLDGTMPAAYPVAASTLLGGALLGYGAFVNRACVFGAIARLGSGEWAYAVTPLGFYVGCVIVGALFPGIAPDPVGDHSVILDGPMWLAALAAAFVVMRTIGALLRQRVDARTWGRQLVVRVARDAWSPHAATCVIGITFIVILLASGAWAYTDVLADLARGMASNLWARLGLLVALFAGAVAGGLSGKRFRSTPVTGSRLARCFAGGLLMGCGSLLIPGSNDGLILIGIPLLRPYAWIAFATMCAVIALALVVARRASATPGPVDVAIRPK